MALSKRPSSASGLYPRVALFAAILASAGLPLYIHLPSFATGELGLDLATLGAVLIAIRMIDLLQDPALGWVVDRYATQRGRLATIGMAGLALGFAMLFVWPAPAWLAGGLLTWLIAALVLVFTSYSLLQILFYGHGVTLADGSSDNPASGNAATRHLRLAGWREAGLLGGILVAASAPQILINLGRTSPYRDFGLLLIVLIALVAVLTRGLWTERPETTDKESVERLQWRSLLAPTPLWLLLIGLINALPVALSSTLFVFFVEERLQLAQFTGLFLILFFCAAGLAAPIWSRAAQGWGARKTLLIAMVLAIVSFGWAAILPEGAAIGFVLVCLASGAAMAADMVILPATFANAVSRLSLPEGLGFGLWAFAAKLALALAAAVALPALARAGFDPASDLPSTTAALGALAFAYAVVPCFLKLLSIALLVLTPRHVLDATPDRTTIGAAPQGAP